MLEETTSDNKVSPRRRNEEVDSKEVRLGRRGRFTEEESATHTFR